MRVLLISDKRGQDDEGMKKTARTLAVVLQGLDVDAEVASMKEALTSLGDVDIIHYIGGPSYRSALFVAACKLINTRIRTILTFTNPHWSGLANAIVSLRPPDKVLVSSTFWKHWADDHSLSNELFAISGVDTSKFRPVSVEQKLALRQSYGIPIEQLMILHVGHLKEDRNLIPLIQVQAQPNMQVVIVGSTTTLQSDALVQTMQDAGCLIIREYQSHIEDFYQMADCYVFPTTDPKAAVQIPLSVLEAMATNIPVVTTNFGGLPDFFSAKNGLVMVRPDQLRQLPNYIMQATSQTVGTRGLIESFKWEVIGENLKAVYGGILAN